MNDICYSHTLEIMCTQALRNPQVGFEMKMFGKTVKP